MEKDKITKNKIPNQRTILIERSSINPKEGFLKVSNESLDLAMLNLSPNAFKLWIYFTDNASGYKFELYATDFTTKANISQSTYYKCFKELEEKGYLINSPKEKNFYLFRERSNNKDLKSLDHIWSIEDKALEDIIEEFFNIEVESKEEC